MLIRLAVALLSACLGLGLAPPAAAQVAPDDIALWPGEKVLSFDSRITVNADTTVTVVETIVVESQQNVIQRGITRDLVQDFRDRADRLHRMKLDIQGILHDGNSSEYHTADTPDGRRIYVGEEDVFIAAGTHTYELTYSVSDALALEGEQAELLWDVTGNQWAFPIGLASATVVLPQGVAAADIAAEAYTGTFGETGTDFTGPAPGSATPAFKTTRILLPGEGLTVSVRFPAAALALPDDATVHAPEIIAAIGLALLLAYLIFAWSMVGKDPAPGSIMPENEPPDGMSPAAMRFLQRMGCDFKCFTCTLISLASKGCLTMAVDISDDYTLMKIDGDHPGLPAEERAVWQALFKSAHMIEVGKSNQATLAAARSALDREIRRQYGGRFFSHNVGWMVIGWLISALTLFLVLGASTDLLARPNIVVLGTEIMLIVALNILFGKLLPAYKPAGRRLLDRIEGFRQTLVYSTPKDQPGHTDADREKFDRFLAYALALDLHSQWVRQFEERLDKDAAAPRNPPMWYYDPYMHGNGFNYRSFMYNLNDSFNSSLSSASTPSSSSSGSGGGFSGGGGGGGGGGGW